MPMVLLETEWDAVVVVVVRVAFAQFILRKEYGDFFTVLLIIYTFSLIYYSNRKIIVIAQK